MQWIWENWWQVMDWLAREPVENGLSVLAGYIAFCTAFVSIAMPGSVLVRFVPRLRTFVIAISILAAVVLFVVVLFEVHHALNLYQIWYRTPLGPSL
jgi:hypothetical protein